MNDRNVASDVTLMESLENLVTGRIRLALALSGLFITWLDPAGPDRHVPLVYATLILYALYSVSILVLASRYPVIEQWIRARAHWVDVAWFTLLIALSSGTSSIFFLAFFFPVLAAAFQWGFRSGLQVSFAAVSLFTTVSLLTFPPGGGFELNRFLLRSSYLLALGYMIAYWGGIEVNFRRQLILLKQVTHMSNPRFGVDRTVGTVIEHLRGFYKADSCLMVMADINSEGYRLFCSERSDSSLTRASQPSHLPISSDLMALPTELAVSYVAPSGRGRQVAQCDAFDVMRGHPVSVKDDVVKSVSETFAASSLLSVPLLHEGRILGRIYFIWCCPRSFRQADIEFILQIFDRIVPVVEIIRLVDRLTLDAAEAERQRIAHNIHDSIIQNHLGLQAGLEGIRRKIAAGTDVAADVDRLISLTALSVTDLRYQVAGLRGPQGLGNDLLTSIKRFGEKFAAASNIVVEVESKGEISVSEKLATEVFQMVAEGLSNIRRHTEARYAHLTLSCLRRSLVLCIQNDFPDGVVPVSFTPYSLSERAAALGGHARVEIREDNATTTIVIDIPL